MSKEKLACWKAAWLSPWNVPKRFRICRFNQVTLSKVFFSPRFVGLQALKGAIWSLSNWKLNKANKVHTGQEIELLENISQQLKSILAKFHTIHLKNRKKPSKSDFQSMNEKVSPGADLSNQTMSKMRVEILLVAWHKLALDWEGRSNTFLSP